MTIFEKNFGQTLTEAYIRHCRSDLVAGLRGGSNQVRCFYFLLKLDPTPYFEHVPEQSWDVTSCPTVWFSSHAPFSPGIRQTFDQKYFEAGRLGCKNLILPLLFSKKHNLPSQNINLCQNSRQKTFVVLLLQYLV